MFVPCQDQRALPPETVPETGELEGQTPRENLEKDLLEDRGETKTLQSQEPELLKGPGEYSKPWNSAELVTPSYGGMGLGSQHHHPWMGRWRSLSSANLLHHQRSSVPQSKLLAWLLDGNFSANIRFPVRPAAQKMFLVKCGTEFLSGDSGSIERQKNPQEETDI